jgi:hypothetical protein
MVFTLLLSLSLCECETQGTHVVFGPASRDLAEAYYDSASDSGTHYIIFLGSFLPRVSGLYRFTVTCETYFTSFAEAAVAHLEWDGETVKNGKDSWEWNTQLTKDWRYSYKCATDDNFYWATLRLEVMLPDGESFTLSQDYSDTCTNMGCRNLSLTRDTNCQPPDGIRRVLPASPVAVAEPEPSVLGRGGVIAIAAVAAVVAVVIVVGVVIVKKRKGRETVEIREALLKAGKDPVGDLASLEVGEGA